MSLLEGPEGHFPRQFRAHPNFWRHSLGHPQVHFGPEGPKTPARFSQGGTKPLLGCNTNGGLRDGGLSKSEDIRGERSFFLYFLDFLLVGALQTFRTRANKAERRVKKPETPDFWEGQGRHPLNPHLLHPHLRQPNFVVRHHKDVRYIAKTLRIQVPSVMPSKLQRETPLASGSDGESVAKFPNLFR